MAIEETVLMQKGHHADTTEIFKNGVMWNISYISKMNGEDLKQDFGRLREKLNNNIRRNVKAAVMVHGSYRQEKQYSKYIVCFVQD